MLHGLPVFVHLCQIVYSLPEVFHHVIVGLALLSEVRHDHAACTNNLAWESIIIYLAEPSPLSKLLVVRNIDEWDILFQAEALHQFLVSGSLHDSARNTTWAFDASMCLAASWSPRMTPSTTRAFLRTFRTAPMRSVTSSSSSTAATTTSSSSSAMLPCNRSKCVAERGESP